jgi:hypothetical protein
MNVPSRSAAALLLLAAAGAAPASDKAVYRCEVDGRVIYQQSACKSGQRVELPPANVADAPPPRPPAPAAPPPPVQTAPAQATVPAAAVLPLQAERETCLAYLKPLLHDPASARVLDATRDGRVLKVQLQAADRRGRLQTRDAACEFINGRVDDGWSRIQLERLGWFAKRKIVLHAPPDKLDRDARRLLRAQEESIEKDG